ncbi:hypothetical protein AX16_007710 [Volvariella volvacea WC 439]|nr:hypothetical protein AX16_007710 [Volvariella volvacea WC 439]
MSRPKRSARKSTSSPTATTEKQRRRSNAGSSNENDPTSPAGFSTSVNNGSNPESRLHERYSKESTLSSSYLASESSVDLSASDSTTTTDQVIDASATHANSSSDYNLGSQPQSQPQTGSQSQTSGSFTSTTGSLIFLQASSRLLTFTLNQCLLHFSTPTSFGVASIHFELLLSTILFLSREGVRNALLRVPRVCYADVSGEDDADGNEGSEGAEGSKKDGNGVVGTGTEHVGNLPPYSDRQGSNYALDKEKEQERAKILEERAKRKKRRKVRNVAVLPILGGIVVALFMVPIYLGRWAGEEVKKQKGFKGAVAGYVLAALVELLSEPMHNMAMAELRTNTRVRAEGLGMMCKAVITVLILLWDNQKGGKGDMALLAFAAGQIMYSLVLLAVYSRQYGFDLLRLKGPLRGESEWQLDAPFSTWFFDWFDADTVKVSWTMTTQSLVKHFLTEGDKLVLSWFSPLQDQGGYAIAVNYGSLVARIIFQPIEESLRVFYSKTLSAPPPASASQPVPSSPTPPVKSPKSSKSSSSASSSALTNLTPTSKTTTQVPTPPTAQYPYANLQIISITLLSVLTIQSSLSLIFVFFVTFFLPLFLSILLPTQYLSTSAPKVLQAWVWYIPVLAFNGGLEAFVSSVSTPHELNVQSRWMTLFSVIYISSAITFYNFGIGDSSLVYANIINLGARIIYALRFASVFFSTHLRPYNHINANVQTTFMKNAPGNSNTNGTAAANGHGHGEDAEGEENSTNADCKSSSSPPPTPAQDTTGNSTSTAAGTSKTATSNTVLTTTPTKRSARLGINWKPIIPDLRLTLTTMVSTEILKFHASWISSGRLKPSVVPSASAGGDDMPGPGAGVGADAGPDGSGGIAAGVGSVVGGVLTDLGNAKGEWYGGNGASEYLKEIVREQGRMSLFNRVVLEHFALGGFLVLVCLCVWWFVDGRRVVKGTRSLRID